MSQVFCHSNTKLHPLLPLLFVCRLGLTMKPGLASNLRISCLSLLSAGMTGVYPAWPDTHSQHVPRRTVILPPPCSQLWKWLPHCEQHLPLQTESFLQGMRNSLSGTSSGGDSLFVQPHRIFETSTQKKRCSFNSLSPQSNKEELERIPPREPKALNSRCARAAINHVSLMSYILLITHAALQRVLGDGCCPP